MRQNVPERYCLVIATGGEIVSEHYFANNTETLYELDSAAKTFIAATMGTAVQKGLLNLSHPIGKYEIAQLLLVATRGAQFMLEIAQLLCYCVTCMEKQARSDTMSRGLPIGTALVILSTMLQC